MDTTKITSEIYAEWQRAREKFPAWPINIVQAAAILAEEAGEVTKAVNTYYWRQGDITIEDIRKEVIQTGAMINRFLLETPAMQGFPDQATGNEQTKGTPAPDEFTTISNLRLEIQRRQVVTAQLQTELDKRMNRYAPDFT